MSGGGMMDMEAMMKGMGSEQMMPQDATTADPMAKGSGKPPTDVSQDDPHLGE
jgi:hypothetical protein